MTNADSAYIGGQGPMTDEFKDILNRQASGMPPVGATDVTTRLDGEAVTVPVSLARNALNKHMAILGDRIAAEIEDPYRFMGNGPYLDQMRAQWRIMADQAMAQKEQAKAELAELEKLTDEQVIDWAVKGRHLARHVNGGWVLV